MNHKYLKYFLAFLTVIPTERPQDLSFVGKGKVKKLSGKTLTGEGTQFQKEIIEKFTIKLCDHEKSLFVLKVIDDTTLEVDNRDNLNFDNNEEAFKVLPKVDQSGVFSAGWKCLGENKVLAIFPEGGSHDRTTLLPLKAGVSIFCLGAIEKYKTDTQILCTGINYDKPHMFRSVVVIEFGKPYGVIDEDIVRYADPNQKKEVINEFMDKLTDRLKDVRLITYNYEMLMNIHLGRQLYIPDDVEMTDKEKLVIERKFAEVYEKGKDFKDIQLLINDIGIYRKGLRTLGLSDWQLKTLYPSVLKNAVSFTVSASYITIVMLIGLPG